MRKSISGGYGWRVGKSLALGFVKPELAAEDTELEILITDLLGNDDDVDGNQNELSLVDVTRLSTTQGTVSLSGPNVIYNPNGKFDDLEVGASTTDTFTYTITDDAIVFTNDPFVIARNDGMISINSALAVDLTGQVAADTLMGMGYTEVYNYAPGFFVWKDAGLPVTLLDEAPGTMLYRLPVEVMDGVWSAIGATASLSP